MNRPGRPDGCHDTFTELVIANIGSRHLFDRYLNTVLQWPRAIVLVSVALALAITAGMHRLSIDDDFRVYFSEDNPQLAALERFESTFDREDSVAFIVYPREGEVFRPEVLRLVYELTDEGWLLPHATRVSSIANHQHSYARGDELFVEPLIADPAQLDAEISARIREIALSEPSLLDSLVGSDGRATTVFVRLTLPEDDEGAAEQAVSAARKLAEDYRPRYPGVELLLAGSSTTNVVLGEAILQDFRTLVVLSFVIIAAGLALGLRSAAGMIATLSLVALSVGATMGLFGWLGAELAPVAGFVPSVVMTIAVADAVHILVTYFYHLRAGDTRRAALREAMRINASPVFITSITTVIGVLSLNFSDSPPYRALGNMVAAGVAFAYLLSMTFLPALLVLLPARPGRMPRGARLPMDGLASWIIRHRRALLAANGIAVVVLAGFALRNELSERWFEYFDESFEYRQAIDVVDEHIGGIDGIEYVLDSGEPDGINDPEYLRTLAAFADWYRAQPGVTQVSSLSDTLKRLNRNMHGDDPAWYRVPEQRELAAQYLLLYELSLPQGLGLDTVIDTDRSATSFGVRARKMDSAELLALEARAQEWLAANAPVFLPTEGTGLDVVFAHLNERNIRTMLKGTAIALVLISVVLMFALRSVKLGLVSLVPNLAPAALSYGLWGMLVGRIDVALSVVIAMSLGIVVDDTVHFMSKYLRARRERGLPAADAIHYAFNTVGVALTITTVVLVTGFSVLAASHFNPTSETGTLLAITLAFALFVDFLLLPPLLLVLDQRAGATLSAATRA